MKIDNPFRYTEAELYQYMKEQGDKRFGSECKHEKTQNGVCRNCFRKVIDKR